MLQHPQARRLATGAALPSAGLLVAALLLGPRSCEPGVQNTYLGLGVAYLVVLAALPFVVAGGWSLAARAGSALLLILTGAGVWIGGLTLGNFRIICRLF